MINPLAFPRPASEFTGSGTLADGNDAISSSDGMTLHDYFAAAALQGILATGGDSPPPDKAARWAYSYADAMLSRRQEGGDS